MAKKSFGLLFVTMIGLLFFQISCILEPTEIPVYYISVISPRQDTTILAGKNFYVQWRSSLTKFPYVTVTLHNTKTDSTTLIAKKIKNTGLFYWKVSSGILSGDNYIIQVTGIGDTTIAGISAPFSILNKYDIYEPDDSISIATKIPTNGTIQTHNLPYYDDVDWFKFSATAGKNYLIRSGSPLKKSVCLYGNNSKLILPNGYGPSPSITWTCSTSGTYFFSVSSENRYNSNYSDTLPYTIFVKSGNAIINILNPQPGEIDTAGEPMNLQWQMTSNVLSVIPKILRNDSIIASVDDSIYSKDQYTWYLPVSLTSSSSYKIILYNKTDSSIHSDPVPFSIVSRPYSITVSTTINTTLRTFDSTVIKWKCIGIPRYFKYENLRMDLCKDRKKVAVIRDFFNDTTGTYIWEIPNNVPTSSNYQVRVSCVNDTFTCGFSEDFTINQTPSSFKIYTPSPGTILKNDTMATIQFSVKGKPVSSFKIDLYDDKTFILNIFKTTSKISSNFYGPSWIVPASVPSGLYRIKITANDDSTISSWSSFFSIIHVPTSLSFTSPILNSSCSGACKVSWQSIGPVGDRVSIVLYNDTTQELNGYRNYILNNGTYDFIIPVNVPIGNRYRMKIYSFKDTTINSFSDFFTIVPLPKTITITTPTTNSVFTAGQSETINWTSKNIVDQYSTGSAFTIDLYDSTSFLSEIYKAGSTPGGFSWNVPVELPVKSSYRIKMTSIKFPDVYAFSNYFTIKH